MSDLPPDLDAIFGIGGESQSQIQAFVKANPALIERLRGYHQICFAAILSGLMTKPENHAAWPRLELLQHLVVAYCRGSKIATAEEISNVVNNDLTDSMAAMMEDPVEDVFTTNVAAWRGNVPLISGGWPDNDYSLQSCINALQLMEHTPWRAKIVDSLDALMRLTAAVSSRAELKRNIMVDTSPRQPIEITPEIVSYVQQIPMLERRLVGEEVIAGPLRPFLISSDEADGIANEDIGASVLDRKPLIQTAKYILYALPSAASAAARQFILREAQTAGMLDLFNAALQRVQLQEVEHLGCAGWKIELMGEDELGFKLQDNEFIGHFDTGGYAHVVYSDTDTQSVIENGLTKAFTEAEEAAELFRQRAATLTARKDFRRGLAILVMGGIGGGVGCDLKKMPEQWHFIGLHAGDFLRLGYDHDNNALRAWKLYEQVLQLSRQDVHFMNLSGYLNIYSWALKQEFHIAPPSFRSGTIWLDAFMAPLQHRLRSVLDEHAAMLPEENAFISIQRYNPSAFDTEFERLPMYYSPDLAEAGIINGCRETKSRIWWVQVPKRPKGKRYTRFEVQIWEVAISWLTRLVTLTEEALPKLPKGRFLLLIEVSENAENQLGSISPPESPVEPGLKIDGRTATISCSLEYLLSFRNPLNIGDRMMAATLVKAAFGFADTPVDQSVIDRIVSQVIPDDHARFVHARPARSISEQVYSVCRLPRMRLIPEEDRAWAARGLAEQAGWTDGPGEVPADRTSKLLNDAVATLWKRIKERLRNFDRKSVVSQALLNNEAVEKDRSQWKTTAAAWQSLYEQKARVMEAAVNLESRRSIAGLSSRVLAEMAICECPTTGGAEMTGADFDAFMGDICVLIEYASHSDSVLYKLAPEPLRVFPDGSFEIDHTVYKKLLDPYLKAHGARGFEAAAASYAKAYNVDRTTSDGPGPELNKAFVAEFGMPPRVFAEFLGELANQAMSRSTSQFAMKQSKLIAMLKVLEADDPAKALNSLTLRPRKRWDEPKPDNAQARDWYPWRFNRRLSITRRPLVQIGEGDDPEILISPTMLEHTARFMLAVVSGDLPITLFDSKEMRELIGAAADAEGHGFALMVAERLRALGMEALTEVKLTELGGTQAMGDVDVLAWRIGSNRAYIIECKRLAFARTTGEIGERLEEYSTTAAEGEERTPIQKHIDRMTFLKATPAEIARKTGIPSDKLELVSTLVTDVLVPMQFSDAALSMVDLIADVSQISDKFAHQIDQ